MLTLTSFQKTSAGAPWNPPKQTRFELSQIDIYVKYWIWSHASLLSLFGKVCRNPPQHTHTQKIPFNSIQVCPNYWEYFHFVALASIVLPNNLLDLQILTGVRLFQGWACVSTRVYGIYDQPGDRERPVELGSWTSFPSSYLWRQALHHCTGTICCKF